MKKKIWNKSSLLPISIIVIVSAIILACAGGDDTEDYPSSFFAPEITHNNKYAMFFRSYHYLYSVPDKRNYEPEFNFKESYVSDFNSINTQEWSAYFKQNVNDKDLEYILYRARLGEIDTLIFSIKKPGYPASNVLKSNSVLKVADTRSALDFLYYVGFAKRCEKYATYEPDWWDDRSQPDPNDPRNDKSGMAALEAGGLKQMTNTKSGFVGQRYAFQVLRLYYMSKDYDKCIQFHDEQNSLFESNSTSIKYRAMGYLAGAYFAEKKYSDANYLYSVIYDRYDTMKVTAYFSFKPQEEQDWQQTLSMAKSPREKAVLWQLLGIYADPLRAMKEVYALDPKSDLLDLLLARAVNEEEEKFIFQTGEYDGSETPSADSSGYLNPSKINKELVDFLNMVADKRNTAKPYEWSLATGYLDWASGNKDFVKYLDKANEESPKDSLVQDQVRLIKFLDFVKTGKAGNKKFEEALLAEFHWLRTEKHAEYFREQTADAFVMGNLIRKYEAIHDTMDVVCLKGELTKNSKKFKALLDNIVAFMDKPNKTPFEQFALSQLHYSKADIIDMEALKPFYDRDFQKALEILKKEDAAGGEKNFGDPFVIHINDCHDCDDTDPKKGVYSVRSFIERMIRLEDSVKSPSRMGGPLSAVGEVVTGRVRSAR